MATEPVEVQYRVRNEGPWVKFRGLMMLGIAVQEEIDSRECMFGM